MKVALWFGLVAAALELVAVVVQKHLFHHFVFVGRDVWWTVPLVNLCLFGSLGLVLNASARFGREDFWWRAGLWAGSFFGSMGILLVFQQVYRLAMLVLAAGVATQVTRLGTSRREAFAGLVARTLPWLLIASVVTGVAVTGRQWWNELAILAALPAARPDAPNVLVIVLDTVRAASLSLYGYSRPTTPNLERWAERGALFTEAFSTAPWTLPSHASIVTGRWQPELSTNWATAMDKTDPTLAEVLASRGYATAGFVGNHAYAGTEAGIARGFAHFDDYSLTPSLILRSSALGRSIGRNKVISRVLGNSGEFGRKDAPAVSEPFLEWTAKHRERPWFVLLNYYDAHRPYLPPDPYRHQFGTAEIPPNPQFALNVTPDIAWTAEDGEQFKVAYDGTLAYLDAELNALFAALRDRGDLDRTLVILTSDHGEEFGEHDRLWGHGNSLYLPSVHVPLLMIAPGLVPAGSIVTTPVSNRDIPATVLDLLGHAQDSPFPGRPLSRFWRDPDAGSAPDADDDLIVTGVSQVWGQPTWLPVSKGAMVGLFQGGFHYVKNLGDGTEELFNYRTDPFEQRDLSEDDESRLVLERFREALTRVPGLEGRQTP
jgi:arylsulfatase A-like enzyme